MGQSQSVPELSKVSPSHETFYSTASPSTSDSDSSRSCQGRSTLDGLPINCPVELENCKGNVAVESLGIYMRPVESKTSLNHHVLIVDVDHVMTKEGKDKSVGFIMAEKVVDKGKGKIVVESWSRFNVTGFEEKRVLTLAGCGTIPMERLMEILKEPTADYNLLKENCWKYADQTFRRLIEDFANRAEPQSETKQTLERYLSNLPPLRLPGDAFDFKLAVGCVCVAFAVIVGGGYFLGQAASAAAAASTAASHGVATHSVLGLGMPILRKLPVRGPLSGALSDAVSHAAISHPAVGSILATNPSTAHFMLNVEMILGYFSPAVTVTLLAGAALAAACPQVVLSTIGIVAGVSSVLNFAWVLYKLINGLRGGLKDELGFGEFLLYLSKGFFNLPKGFFKWFVRLIGSLFKGRQAANTD